MMLCVNEYDILFGIPIYVSKICIYPWPIMNFKLINCISDESILCVESSDIYLNNF